MKREVQNHDPLLPSSNPKDSQLLGLSTCPPPAPRRRIPAPPGSPRHGPLNRTERAEAPGTVWPTRPGRPREWSEGPDRSVQKDVWMRPTVLLLHLFRWSEDQVRRGLAESGRGRRWTVVLSPSLVRRLVLFRD